MRRDTLACAEFPIERGGECPGECFGACQWFEQRKCRRYERRQHDSLRQQRERGIGQYIVRGNDRRVERSVAAVAVEPELGAEPLLR
jgi:hypothetical protein